MPKKKVKKEVVEPAPEPEPEKDYVEYTTSKGVVKRKQKVEDPPFEWLECDLEDDELEEISSMAGGSVEGYSLPLGAKPRKRKKVSEKEVNEALNYLLQKLGV